jgi:succinate dehydrogenase (ubiquinone) flavoprotein subunit
MGGIPTNWKTQVVRDASNAIVPGLYAAGEAGSASVHGANRLGANSLLDLVVFGRQAADTTAELVKPNSPPIKLPANAGEESIARMDKIRHCNGPLPTAALRTDLQRTMQTYAPVYRNSEDLKIGKDKVEVIMKKYRRYY